MDSKFYIGSTTNVEKRLKEHNSGSVKSTKHRTPFEVVGYKKYSTRAEAVKKELWLKKQKDRKAILRFLEK